MNHASKSNAVSASRDSAPSVSLRSLARSRDAHTSLGCLRWLVCCGPSYGETECSGSLVGALTSGEGHLQSRALALVADGHPVLAGGRELAQLLGDALEPELALAEVLFAESKVQFEHRRRRAARTVRWRVRHVRVLSLGSNRDTRSFSAVALPEGLPRA